MKKNFELFFFFLAALIVPALCQASVTILTNTNHDHTVTSSSYEQVYGTSTPNQITLESGAEAELINFPGQNNIQIQSSSDLFTVSRSGSVVTFQGSDGTVLQIPATASVQTIAFNGEQSKELQIYNSQVILDDQVVTTTADSIDGGSEVPGDCGAYVSPGVWKEFDCYNLAAIGKETGADPFTPSWELIGGYWQWGRKGPDSCQWFFDTNTKNFAHGPTGPGSSEANADSIADSISSWDDNPAPDGAWSDATKTANDPCPDGYRVPSRTEWEGVIDNNTQSTVGTWDRDDTNYSSARFFGEKLMLPAAGYRYNYSIGSLHNRGFDGNYWSSTEDSGYYLYAWYLIFYSSTAGTTSLNRRDGFSVRCIAE